MNYIFFTLASVLYYALHSILASDRVKACFTNISAYYRLIYNMVNIILLAALLFWMFTLSDSVLFELPSWAAIMVGLILFVGIVLLYFSLRNYNLGEFSGIKQLSGKSALEDEYRHLKITGLNRFVRHPLYLSLLIIFPSAACLYPTYPVLLAVLVSLLYLPFGIWSEEKKLIRHFGQAYIEYKKSVPAILPFAWH
jgi:protein-S-isoprenylcysteine O-methyltransferase Ste14